MCELDVWAGLIVTTMHIGYYIDEVVGGRSLCFYASFLMFGLGARCFICRCVHQCFRVGTSVLYTHTQSLKPHLTFTSTWVGEISTVIINLWGENEEIRLTVAVFRSTISCSNPEKFAIVIKTCSWKLFFGSKILGGGRTSKLDAEIVIPLRGYIT